MAIYSVNSRLIIAIIASLTISLTGPSSFAQIFNSEQNPPGVKWRQINASGFRIIYPTELEKEAQRMSNTITHIYPYVGASLGELKTIIPIILQNRGVIANGFVQLAPKKSEFYTTPPQQFDSQDWLNNLAVHELRHVAQFDKLTGEKAQPFPETVYFAWLGVSIPLWYFEGDAVSTETSLTNAGRGRIPSWIMPYRTQLLEGKKYSYTKSNFDSEKDLTPGYYQLGYTLASRIREASGKYVFDSVLTDIRHHPARLYPFSKSLKKFSGKGTTEWFRTNTEKLRAEWTEQAHKTPSKDYPVLNKKADYATSYFLPVKINDQQIIALKQSKGETPHFVRIGPDKKEKKLRAIGLQEQPWFSYAKGVLVWDEVRYDPRFKQQSFSVINRYDLKSGRVHKLSSRSRLFSPSLSSDGSKIIAVRYDLSNQANLVELDAKTGATLHTYPNPNNLILQTPSFNPDGTAIAFIAVTEQGKELRQLDRNGKTEVLIPFSQQQLSRPIYFSKGIAFNAHYNGIDNIYYLDIASKKISALSAAKYGAFNPAFSADEQTMIFNNYGIDGYEITETSIQAKAPGESHFVFLGAAAAKQENTGNVFNHIPDSSYTSKTYGGLKNLFRVHSVNPVIEDEYRGGLQINSDNLLNTMNVFAGVNYFRDLGRFEYNAGFTYKGFYPVLGVTYRNRPRRAFYNSSKGVQQGDWRENDIRLAATLPFSLNALNDNYNFSFSTTTSYTKRYHPENMPKNYINTLKFPLEYSFSFTHSIRQSERDVAPKWAQILRLTYLHQPFDKQLTGDLFAAETFFYFPGIARNHSFLANFSFQHSSGIRTFDQQINTVYGYNNIPAINILKNTLLLNYRFPIAFPDAEVGALAYVRNLRGGLFCHYENLGEDTNLSQPKTFGFELRSSMNLLRYQPVVDIGARMVFVNKFYHQNPILELILNYSF
ncbi:hypothetical protein [Pedobacter gandavensis]|uniref:Uncharacterized protein n=1 Tax=Pedobacter gandavensis TaxID=2679963 RepID=A0ABR6EZT4_9SPHI|nr:hypothetical protein [Pedobacter gandavensis]MBB2150745.1 hypothetical protein [Pedobacter gandavensis]